MDYKISIMDKDEVDLACDWAAKEGWGPGIHDDLAFYAADNHGFFKGMIGDEIVAVGSMVAYDDAYAFSGLYIVKPEFRGQGFGLKLTKARLEYAGSRITGLDGVLERTHLYERIGYRSAFMNHRYLINHQSFETASAISDYKESDFDELKKFDRQFFPAERDAFLQLWLAKDNGMTLLYRDNGELKGYGTIRPCLGPSKIGPLFAENEEVAEALFRALLSYAGTDGAYLDVPDNNPEALALAKRHQMDKVFSTMRMYRNGEPDIDDKGVFGITTFELG